MIIEDAKLRNLEYVFEDREHAGRLLAEKLKRYSGENVVVLSIPSGGVPVGKIVAEKLNAKFDLVIVRKIQFPDNPEAGFGAVSFNGKIILNQSLVEQMYLSSEIIDKQIEKTKKEIKRRVEIFRGGKPFPKLAGKITILIDDGLASGYTMLAAAESVRMHKPKKIIVAVPTGSMSAIAVIEKNVDEIVCLNVREVFSFAVADAYTKWYDLTEKEVLRYLKK